MRRQITSLDIPTAEAFEPLLAPTRYKGAHGGRGSGKSRFFAGSAIEWALMRPGTRGLFVREHQTSLMQSVKPLHERVLQELGVGRYFDVQRDRIVTPGDGEFVYQGMANHNAESVKSFEGFDFAHVEEAQTLSQRSLTLLTPTIRKPGSEIWFSWNRKSPKDPVDVFFREGRPNARCVQANYWSNPWFPDVLRVDMEFDKRRDIERYLHVWEGHYLKHSEARVFRNWRVGTPEEFAALELHQVLGGADWGYSIDPSVLIEMGVKGRTLYITREAYRIGCEIDHLPALFDTIPGSRKLAITADSSRPDTISYMRRCGFSGMRPAQKGPNSVQEGVEFLRSYDIVIHPDCTHTIDEFTHYSYKVDKMTEEVLPILEDKKNHVIDSCRYAVEPLRAPKIGLH